MRHVHDELFKRTITRDGAGTIIKQIGDSFLCVFSEPTAAVQRAVEFQRAVRANKENLTAEGYTLTVRIGIHLGQVAVEDALRPDVFGRHVNMAARIEALATGGQVLTSRSVWENASGWVAGEEGPGIGYIAYGKARLKGFDDPVEVFGFHAKETGALPAPAAIRKRRVQATLLASLAAIVVLVGMFALFQPRCWYQPGCWGAILGREALLLPVRLLRAVQGQYARMGGLQRDQERIRVAGDRCICTRPRMGRRGSGGSSHNSRYAIHPP
ncbi:MAG: adenylate/guanylate cyclase domain-containing protein [Flavobacteriales bacterium]|nr:adenylate/guanylate cyclase domain-containing protein [Flavobacteriales bacterium]